VAKEGTLPLGSIPDPEGDDKESEIGLQLRSMQNPHRPTWGKNKYRICNSLINPWLMLNGQFLVEDE
jgi:hypothetical protein